MSLIVMKGVVQNGQVIVEEPINLPNGSEVTITAIPRANLAGVADSDRPMTPEEIARTLAAMDRIEPFDISPEEEVEAAAWEKKVNAYAIANTDKGLEDLFR
jgi:hypothetical protein